MTVTYGHFLSKTVKCYNCQQSCPTHEEKKTDVNIAVSLLEDAYDDQYDVAILLSGDSDLAPPVRAVQARFPSKRIVVAFPPRRNSSELRADRLRSIRIRRSTSRARR